MLWIDEFMFGNWFLFTKKELLILQTLVLLEQFWELLVGKKFLFKKAGDVSACY